MIHPGRFTAHVEGPFVVFVIGMRVNQLWKPWKWIPVSMEMGPMLKELFTSPEKGFLGAHTWIGWRMIALVQYWRSVEDLEKFARAQDDPHLEAWRRFNRRVGNDGSVGIWHETFLVDAGKYEAIYGNMPRFGLAAARGVEHLPAVGQRENLRRRLGGDGDSAVTPAANP